MYVDAASDLLSFLAEQGLQHERRVLAELIKIGRKVIEIDELGKSTTDRKEDSILAEPNLTTSTQLETTSHGDKNDNDSQQGGFKDLRTTTTTSLSSSSNYVQRKREEQQAFLSGLSTIHQFVNSGEAAISIISSTASSSTSSSASSPTPSSTSSSSSSSSSSPLSFSDRVALTIASLQSGVDVIYQAPLAMLVHQANLQQFTDAISAYNTAPSAATTTSNTGSSNIRGPLYPPPSPSSSTSPSQSPLPTTPIPPLPPSIPSAHWDDKSNLPSSSSFSTHHALISYLSSLASLPPTPALLSASLMAQTGDKFGLGGGFSNGVTGNSQGNLNNISGNTRNGSNSSSTSIGVNSSNNHHFHQPNYPTHPPIYTDKSPSIPQTFVSSASNAIARTVSQAVTAIGSSPSIKAKKKLDAKTQQRVAGMFIR